MAVLDPAQVSLIKAAAFTEDHLRQPLRLPQGAHTLAKGNVEGLIHASDYPELPLIHIHTNSHKKDKGGYRMKLIKTESASKAVRWMTCPGGVQVIKIKDHRVTSKVGIP